MREAKLPYPPEPLKLNRIDELSDQRSFRRTRIDADNVMYGIAVNSFCQASLLQIRLNSCNEILPYNLEFIKDTKDSLGMMMIITIYPIENPRARGGLMSSR